MTIWIMLRDMLHLCYGHFTSTRLKRKDCHKESIIYDSPGFRGFEIVPART